MGKHGGRHEPVEDPRPTMPAYMPALGPVPDWPQEQQAPAVPVESAPARVRTPVKTAAIVALAIYGAVTTFALVVNTDTGAGNAAAAAATPFVLPEASSTESPSPSPSSPRRQPRKSDFELTIKEKRRKCFGTAGCNVTFSVDLTLRRDVLDPDEMYEVTYRVKGAESPFTDTMTVIDGRFYPDDETLTGVPEGLELTAAVTGVEVL